ncbi:MAG: cobyric acid synthase [Vulcanimicrobiaceae bacterium]
MVLGTASDVGKSLVVMGLCRYLARRGVNVAPFKAQNMSLNSASTPLGREIGRAQALQAEAAGIPAHSDMNPVLLKPTSNTGSQVILNGEIWGTIHADDFRSRNREVFWPHVVAAYNRLADNHDVIILEGAGSPAEINLRDGDIVNMAMAHESDARCILLADIDRGGVFGSIFGTLALLDETDRSRIDAFAINKFRGDIELLRPGIEMLAQRCDTPCLGVIPHLGIIGLEEEDGLALARRGARGAWSGSGNNRRLRIAIVPLPHISNFSDFDALFEEPSVEARYTAEEAEINDADVVILPGTKETLADLAWLRDRGLDAAIVRAASQGRSILGICGGMQILGRRIDDPYGVESFPSALGLSLLPLETTFERKKTTRSVVGRTTSGIPISGYEIHVGSTIFDQTVAAFATLVTDSGEGFRDGAVSGRVSGTYVHGAFSGDAFRHHFIEQARAQSGLSSAGVYVHIQGKREERIDRVAEAIGESLDLSRFFPGM